MARKNPHRVFCSSISKQDLALAMLPRSLSTHISKHKLFLKRISRYHRKRSSKPNLPTTKVPCLSRFIEEEHTQPLEEKAVSNQLLELKSLLDNHSPQEIRKAVRNYSAVIDVLDEALDKAEETSGINKELDKCNTDLLATNAKFGLEIMDLKALITKLGGMNTATSEPDTNIRELNKMLMADIGKLRITNRAQKATITKLQKKCGVTTQNKQVASDNGGEPASDLGDEASPRRGAGAEAEASTDSGERTVDGVSTSPSTGQPEEINAVGSSGSPSPDKEASTGRIEGGAPGEEDGKAGSSTDQPQNTNAGGDGDSSPDGESPANHGADGTAGSQAAKKRRRKKRGGTAVRAAKEAAWARANPGAAKDADEGEAVETDGEDTD